MSHAAPLDRRGRPARLVSAPRSRSIVGVALVVLFVAGGWPGDLRAQVVIDSGTVLITTDTNFGEYVVVGSSGTATLVVAGGVADDGDGFVDGDVGSVGTATITGGTWANGNALDVGYAGSGSLDVDGGVVTSGNTTVAAGRLSVTGALGATAVAVTGGTLGGSGSIAGPVSIAAGGFLAPGTSIESLAAEATALSGSATYAYEVDSTNLGALGTAADLLVVAGNLSLDPANGSILTCVDLNGAPNPFVDFSTVFAMINYSGTWNGGLFVYAGTVLADGARFDVGGQRWQIDYDYVYDASSPTTVRPLNDQADYVPTSGAQTFVAITAVPEPSAWALALAGLACGGWSVSRRRRGRV